VKARRSEIIDVVPQTTFGAAWRVQKERMDAGIYFPLFLVQINSRKKFSVFYLSADLQSADMYVPRQPLSLTARRRGWQGFNYNFRDKQDLFVRLI
jgi:type II restriction enzyme